MSAARLVELRQLLSKSSDWEAASLCREYFRISSPPYLVNPSAFTTERADEICDAPAMALRNRFVIVSAVFESLGDWDFRPLLRRINVPALVIEGEKTNVPLDATRQWAAALPHGQLLRPWSGGHGARQKP